VLTQLITFTSNGKGVRARCGVGLLYTASQRPMKDAPVNREKEQVKDERFLA
jgi:hypothetical protein